MLAGDLTLGGFAGATGALSEGVKRKKRMLEREGVVFDEKGRAARGALHYFDRQKGAKRQRTSGTDAAPRTKRELSTIPIPISSVSVGMLRESILNVLTKRGPEKTC